MSIKTYFALHKDTSKWKRRKWEEDKKILETVYQIDKEKRDLKQRYKPEAGKKTTTKLLISFLFFSCTAIEIFTGYVTLRSFKLAEMTNMSPDLTPLITLIGAVVGEVVGFAIYVIKSTKENQQGGIVYDLAMKDRENGVYINGPEIQEGPQIINNDNDADVEITYTDYKI